MHHLALALLLLVTAPAERPAPDYAGEIDAWHAGRIERLEQPGSWLSLVGLFAMGEGRSSFGTGPDAELRLEAEGPALIGHFLVEGTTVRFEATAAVQHDGEPVQTIELAPDNTGDPTVLEAGALSFYLILRHDRPYLRVKDANAPLLTSFEGIERWPVDPQWRVVARWVEYDSPRMMTFPDVLGVPEESAVRGEARFEIDGTGYVLYPNSENEEWMYWVFGDTTNGDESYGGGRFLYSDPPGEDGSLVLDFNRAYNPPCVFTPYATCPLPAAGNVLDLEITAGEKMFGESH